LISWLSNHLELLTLIGLISALIFTISLLSLPWLVAQIPEDYFASEDRAETTWKTHHPVVRLFILIIKNLLGYILLLGGILMLFMPGQGILTIVAGLLLMDYPGKFSLEKRIAGSPAIFKGLNWLRNKAGKPPLKF
jgi:hypothetical protein